MTEPLDLQILGYEGIAYSIVKLAIKDYKEALRKRDLIEIDNLERFFRSQWCYELCSIDGQWIIDNIRRQHNDKKANFRNECKRTEDAYKKRNEES